MYRVKTSDSKNVKTSDGKNFCVSYPVDTTITINESSVIREVPSDFAGLGINFNVSYFTNFIDMAESNPAVPQLFANLGEGNVRIEAGDYRSWYPDTAYTSWPPTAPFFYNKYFVDKIYNIFNAIGWSVTWLINLQDNNPSMFSDMAGYIYSKFGTKLAGIEIGNEPDNYTEYEIRPITWTYSDYLTEWDAYETAIHSINAAIPLCGPVVGDTDWLHSFSHDRGSKIAFLNHHRYPTSSVGTGTIAPTIENLLSKRLMDSTESSTGMCMGYATDASLPLVEGESNCVGAGGKDNVSNTFAAALWGVDYLFMNLEAGISRVNFHGSFETTTYYAPILPDGTPGPLYYAELLFHTAAPAGNSVVSTTVSPNNVAGHAVVRENGKLSVVVVNKDVNYQAHVKITPAGTYSMATAIFLTAPSIDSKTGITLGGNAVAADGSWTSGTPTNLQIIDGYALITMPTGSAAIVTLEG